MPTPNRLTDDDKKRILKLRKDGTPKYRIAAIIGVAPNTVTTFLKNLDTKVGQR